MIYLIILTVFLVSLFLYLLIGLKKSAHMIYVIPLTILFTTGSYFFIDSLFGYSVKQSNEDKFFLLSYWVPEDESKIYLWVVIEEEFEPKALIVPYTEQRHRELIRAEEQMKEGAKFVGRFSEMETEMPESEPQEGSESMEDLKSSSSMAAGGTPKSIGGGFALIHVSAQPHMMQKGY